VVQTSKDYWAYIISTQEKMMHIYTMRELKIEIYTIKIGGSKFGEDPI
jgi:hypothetical protein